MLRITAVIVGAALAANLLWLAAARGSPGPDTVPVIYEAPVVWTEPDSDALPLEPEPPDRSDHLVRLPAEPYPDYPQRDGHVYRGEEFTKLVTVRAWRYEPARRCWQWSTAPPTQADLDAAEHRAHAALDGFVSHYEFIRDRDAAARSMGHADAAAFVAWYRSTVTGPTTRAEVECPPGEDDGDHHHIQIVDGQGTRVTLADGSDPQPIPTYACREATEADPRTHCELQPSDTVASLEADGLSADEAQPLADFARLRSAETTVVQPDRSAAEAAMQQDHERISRERDAIDERNAARGWHCPAECEASYAAARDQWQDAHAAWSAALPEPVADTTARDAYLARREKLNADGMFVDCRLSGCLVVNAPR